MRLNLFRTTYRHIITGTFVTLVLPSLSLSQTVKIITGMENILSNFSSHVYINIFLNSNVTKYTYPTYILSVYMSNITYISLNRNLCHNVLK